MTRLTSLLLVLFLLVAPVSAANRFITGTITTNGDIVPLNADDTGNGSIQITGTWTGTVVFETTNGSTWVALTVTPMPVSTAVTSATANGVWTYTGAFKTIRVRATAAITGTATVSLVSTAAHAGGGGGGTAGPPGTGAVIGDAVTGSTPNTQLYIDAAGKLANTANPTNGQLLCGETGAAPSLCTVTAGSNITVTNAAHSITIASSGGGSGDALTTNPLSQFAATTSAQLAGVLSDETGNSGGTGLAVFSSAPALTNPNLISGTVTTDLAVTASTLWTAVAAPTTPAAGKSRVYVDSGTKTLCNKDDAGTVTCTGAAAGGVTTGVTLTSNLPVIGAGSSAVAVGTRSGNTTAYVTTTGTQTSGRCVEIDANGNHIAAAGVCGSGGSGTVTHTAGNLTSGGMVIGNGTADVKVDTGCSTDGAGALTCASYATSGTNPLLIAGKVGTAPATPSSTFGNIYIDSTSKNLAIKDDAGVVKHGIQDISCTNQAVTAVSAAGAGTCTTTSLTAGITGTLPVANGGTNLTAAADNNIMVGNGTTWETKAVPDCTDTGGNHLNYTASSNALSCGTSGGAGGGVTSDTLTANTIPKASGAAGITNSRITDDGTTVAISGSGGTQFTMTAITAPTATPASTTANVYVDSTSKNLVVKDDAGVYKHGVQTVTCTNQFASAVSDAGAVTCTTLTNTVLPAATLARGIVLEVGSPTGSALTTSDAAYVTIPFKCTIVASDVMLDAADATVSFDVVRAATGGTALPTASILTGGFLGVASGAAVHNANTTLFSSTAIAANDRIGLIVHAANTAKYGTVMIQCNSTD